jgi:hypothetical protein
MTCHPASDPFRGLCPPALPADLRDRVLEEVERVLAEHDCDAAVPRRLRRVFDGAWPVVVLVGASACLAWWVIDRRRIF